MTVKQLIDKLSEFDSEMKVLGEFDSDGDDFMIKLDKCEVYKGDGYDDTGEGDDGEYCILRFDFN